jgi:uncharacterized protein GlcG (DUF336 family)
MTLIQSPNITRGMARVAIEGAIRESLARGKRSCVAVVDAGGNAVSFDRMDGASWQSVRRAQDKAYFEAVNGLIADNFWALVRDDGGEVIGAVGVSGDGGMAEDRAIAEAGAKAVHALLATTRLTEAFGPGCAKMERARLSYSGAEALD